MGPDPGTCIQRNFLEFHSLICDSITDKIKNALPGPPNIAEALFEGRIQHYVDCVNVHHELTRDEPFSDIVLNVRDCLNLMESFQKYAEVKLLDGYDKFEAEGLVELQVSRRGVRYLKLPPVLKLILKRFSFDLVAVVRIIGA